MTLRSYYEDAYTTSFQAKVKEVVELNGRDGLILDQTYFYPTSGGQPNDLGTIEGHSVSDVFVRESDMEIIHVLSKSIAAESVFCEIDWERRFDHMQQHTGQHMLSQAFLRRHEAQTLSFHMGAVRSTIDIELPELSIEEAAAIELQVNQIIWENRPVHHQFASPKEIGDVHMRKPPPLVEESLRLVVIEDYDVSACGGTHVSKTGEIGLIKITKWERRNQAIRIEFLCGKRALLDYQSKNAVLGSLSALYTTSYTELEKSAVKQGEELSEYRKRVRSLERELLDSEAAGLIQEIGSKRGTICLFHIFSHKTPGQLRYIAQQLVSSTNAVVLLANVESRTSLMFAKSEQLKGDMNLLLKDTFNKLGSGSGGGSQLFAQGSTDIVDVDVVQSILDLQCRIYESTYPPSR